MSFLIARLLMADSTQMPAHRSPQAKAGARRLMFQVYQSIFGFKKTFPSIACLFSLMVPD